MPTTVSTKYCRQQSNGDVESYSICYAVTLKWSFRGKAEKLERSTCHLGFHIDYLYTDVKSVLKRSSKIFFAVSEDVAQWQHVCIACVRPWVQAPIGKYKNSVLIISFLMDEELYINSSYAKFRKYLKN